MSPQRKALSSVVVSVRQLHPKVAIFLIGSVARGVERSRSDIDINLLFPGAELPPVPSRYVGEDNRWQLVAKEKRQGLTIDVAWEVEASLRERLLGNEAQECWPFSWGEAIWDPSGIATECLTLARNWFDAHPEVARQRQWAYDRAKNRQRQRFAERKSPRDEF